MIKFNETQCIYDALSGSVEEELQLSLFYNKEATDYFSVKYLQFSFERFALEETDWKN